MENNRTEELQRQQNSSDPNARLYYLAYTLAYSKLDYPMAYKAIRRLLKNESELSKLLLAKALIMKVDLEILNNEYEVAQNTLQRIKSINFHQQAYNDLAEEKQRLAEVTKQLEEL